MHTNYHQELIEVYCTKLNLNVQIFFFSNYSTSTLAIPLRYSWWMVIVVTPIVLIMAVIYTLLDRFKEVTDILGAIVSTNQISSY